ncbi:MAG: DUF4112 domain-containing protein [Pirellulales bacterium]
MADWTVEPDGLPRRIEPQVGEWQFDELPDDEAQRIRRLVEWLSNWMDARFEVPGLGVRFGMDALVGLVPGVGDVVTTLVSLYIIGLAGRTGLPRITLARMSLNVAIDMLLGAIPFVGDLFDVWWKANQRNSRLLVERLTDPAVRNRRATLADWFFVGLMLLALLAVFVGLLALAVFVAAAVWQAVERLFQPR